MPRMHSGRLSNGGPRKGIEADLPSSLQPDAKGCQSFMVCFYSFKQERTCNHTGIKVRKMNHSLQATGASNLFDAELPEKIMQL